jgi:hypothetical protein
MVLRGRRRKGKKRKAGEEKGKKKRRKKIKMKNFKWVLFISHDYVSMTCHINVTYTSLLYPS